MKTLSDGRFVSERSYYFLLDWNDSDKREYIYHSFNKIRLCDLTMEEYRELWEYATRDEYTLLGK